MLARYSQTMGYADQTLPIERHATKAHFDEHAFSIEEELVVLGNEPHDSLTHRRRDPCGDKRRI